VFNVHATPCVEYIPLDIAVWSSRERHW